MLKSNCLVLWVKCGGTGSNVLLGYSWATPWHYPKGPCMFKKKKKKSYKQYIFFWFFCSFPFFDPTQLHHHIPNLAWALSVWLGSPRLSSLWCGKPTCFRAPCWIWACERERRCDRMRVSGFSPGSLAGVLHHRPSLPASRHSVSGKETNWVGLKLATGQIWLCCNRNKWAAWFISS